MKQTNRIIGSGFFIVLVLIIFLTLYHFFLVDVSLKEVQFALERSQVAGSIVDQQVLSSFIQNLSIDELSQDVIDMEQMLALEGSQKILDEAWTDREHMKGVTFFLSRLSKEREDNRFFLVRVLDAISHSLSLMRASLRGLVQSFLSKRYGGAQEAPKELSDFGLEILKEAQKFEGLLQFEVASQKYNQFLSGFQRYQGFGTIKARYGFLQAKMGYYDDARRILKDVIRDFRGRAESDLAVLFLDRVDHLEQLNQRRQFLQNYLNQQSQGAESKPGTALEERIRQRSEYRVESRPKAFMELGMLDLQLYDFQAALEAFQRILNEGPDSQTASKAKFLSAWALKLIQKYRESRELFQKVIEENQGTALELSGEIAIALVDRASGKAQSAAERFERIAGQVGVKKSSLAALLEVQAAYTYLYDLHDVAKAKHAIQNAKGYAELDPDFINFLNHELEPFITQNLRDVAFEYFRRGNIEEAKSLFEDVLVMNPEDPWSLSGLGLAERLLAEISGKGFDFVQRGYEFLEDEFTAAALAYFYESQGETDAAKKFYQKSIQLNPQYLVAQYNLGRMYILEEDFAAAIDRFKFIVQYRVPGSKLIPRAYNNLGLALWRSGQREQAEKVFLEALELDELLPEALYNLALHYEAQGQIDFARKFLDRARAIHMQSESPPNSELKDISNEIIS